MLLRGHCIGMQLLGPTSVLPRPVRTASYQPCNVFELDCRRTSEQISPVRVSPTRRIARLCRCYPFRSITVHLGPFRLDRGNQFAVGLTDSADRESRQQFLLLGRALRQELVAIDRKQLWACIGQTKIEQRIFIPQAVFLGQVSELVLHARKFGWSEGCNPSGEQRGLFAKTRKIGVVHSAQFEEALRHTGGERRQTGGVARDQEASRPRKSGTSSVDDVAKSLERFVLTRSGAGWRH